MQETGFTLAEIRLVKSRERSPAAWRDLAVRKASELRHRIATTQAALEAIEHSLDCPERSFGSCPRFWATVEGHLQGRELADTHARAHTVK